MTPLTRADFVAAAERRAIPTATAQRLFAFGGGPDTIYEAMMDAYAASGEQRLVERASARIGDRLDRFISESFDEPSYSGDGLMERLAVGELRPVEREAVLSHALAKFIVREEKGGCLSAASPILARTILRRCRGPTAVYNDCLTALASGDYARARSLAAALAPTTPRLATFRHAVELICAIDGGAELGLLGVDWADVARLGAHLKAAEETPPAWKDWGATLECWAEAIVGKGTTKDDARQRLDSLTVQAANPDVFLLLEFALSRYVRRAEAIKSPSDRVRRLLMVPEAVLQPGSLLWHRLCLASRNAAGRPRLRLLLRGSGDLPLRRRSQARNDGASGHRPRDSFARQPDDAAPGAGGSELRQAAASEARHSLAESDGAHRCESFVRRSRLLPEALLLIRAGHDGPGTWGGGRSTWETRLASLPLRRSKPSSSGPNAPTNRTWTMQGAGINSCRNK